jgi:tetrapyrrole methylase family protein/MazG family protein
MINSSVHSVESQSVARLWEIVERLRGPGGCPWDIEQTHETLRAALLEESHEVIDAIDKKDDKALCEELGDVLLQIVFHTSLSSEQGSFTFEDVVNGICDKLIYRHPHVFGDTKVADSAQVLINWEALKQVEKKFDTRTQMLESVPTSFPALLRAEKLISRAGKAGYTPDDSQGTDVTQQLWELCRQAKQEGVDLEMELHRRCSEFIKQFERWELNSMASETL